jgi:DNA polymerase-3 subunit gamma/tau
LTTSLLGYTPQSLLDEVVDAFAAGDGGTVFAVVDKVVETGQDPRRFAEDVLQRLRDLLIVAQVPDAVSKGLLDVPADQADQYASQSARFGIGRAHPSGRPGQPGAHRHARERPRPGCCSS